MTWEPTQLEGYKAAFDNIEQLKKVAEKDLPKRKRQVDKRLAAYRRGYHDALVIAFCMSALGEFPASNKSAIHSSINRL